MSVSVSGAVLSSLFYEQSNHGSDSEGFLLGKVVNHVTDEISDSQTTNIKENTVIYVNSYIPCLGVYNWYDSSGRVVHDSFREFFATNPEKTKEVIGWYKFRRNTSFRVSIRERAVHKNVKECFPGIHRNNFVFLLCTASTAYNNGIHSFDHAFHIFDGRTFKGLPMTVVNLGDTVQSEYKVDSTPSSTNTGLFSATVEGFRSQLLDPVGKLQSVMSFRNLNHTLHKELMELCNRVAESERIRGQLERETDDLEKQISAASGTTTPTVYLSEHEAEGKPQRLNPLHRANQGAIPVPMQANSPLLPRRSTAKAAPPPAPPPKETPDLIMLDDVVNDESTEESVPAWQPLNVKQNKKTLLDRSRTPSPQPPPVQPVQTRKTKERTNAVKGKTRAQTTGSKRNAKEKSELDSFDDLWHSAKSEQLSQGNKSRSSSVDSDVMDTSSGAARSKRSSPAKTSKRIDKSNAFDLTGEDEMEYEQSNSPTF